jgi:hypothetical protein
MQQDAIPALQAEDFCLTPTGKNPRSLELPFRTCWFNSGG